MAGKALLERWPGVGQVVRDLLAERGMSQLQLAESANLSRQSLGKLVNGDSLSPSTARSISRVLGVDLERLAKARSGPEREHTANPMLARRLPPPAYEFVYKKLELLGDRGMTEDQIVVAEQLFLNDTYATLNAFKREAMTDADWMKKVNADWRAIEAYLSEG